jgi:hypothetical protein
LAEVLTQARPQNASSLRIVVSGLIAQHPLVGGMTWHYIQYLLGLKRLGHDVYYLEDSGEFPYNFDGGPTGNDWVARDADVNLRHLDSTLARFGLGDRWAYRHAPEQRWYGLTEHRRGEILDSADLLINVSGSLERPWEYRSIPRLAYVDTDPMVTQVKLVQNMPSFRQRINTHDRFFSFGECPKAVTPETGHRWQPTRQPIVLDEWAAPASPRNTWTTVMNWTSYAPLVYEGRRYGQKDVEFRRYLELPERVEPVEFEVALSRTQHLEWEASCEDHPRGWRDPSPSTERRSPREVLASSGWQVVDANSVCANLDAYRNYICGSKAEWSVAKQVYVQARPGWFSERSACYLAAGRPVVVQDTGFGDVLPVGEGLLSFDCLEGAVRAVQEVETNYERHAAAARALAAEYFDSDTVLSRLVADAMEI